MKDISLCCQNTSNSHIRIGTQPGSKVNTPPVSQRKKLRPSACQQLQFWLFSHPSVASHCCLCPVGRFPHDLSSSVFPSSDSDRRRIESQPEAWINFFTYHLSLICHHWTHKDSSWPSSFSSSPPPLQRLIRPRFIPTRGHYAGIAIISHHILTYWLSRTFFECWIPQQLWAQ